MTLGLQEQSWDRQERARMHSHALQSLHKQLGLAVSTLEKPLGFSSLGRDVVSEH